MTQDRLRTIQGPDGRVALTTAPFRDEDLEEVLRNLPTEDRDYECRVVLLGYRDRDPISRIWMLLDRKLAICLPGAFDRVLVEFPEPMPEIQTTVGLRTCLRRIWPADVKVRRATPPGGAEPFEFLAHLAPKHLQADDDLKSLISEAGRAIDPSIPAAIEAGLFQMNDCLEESHHCSQSIEGEGTHRCGDYWHAIMHRREPDFGNAKYWFRQVGRHPVFEELPGIAKRVIEKRQTTELNKLVGTNWDPFVFVDFCEQHAGYEESPAALALREIQGWEMSLLLDKTLYDANRDDGFILHFVEH